MAYSENATCYDKLLDLAAALPEGSYKACTERTNELVGPMLLTRQTSWKTFKSPMKAMMKAKRMAESLDRRTRGQADGIIYFIEDIGNEN